MGRKVTSVWNLLIPVADPKTRVNRLQRYLFPNPDKDVWLCIRQMQLQVEQGRERIEWYNALQPCDMAYILQISAAGKAAVMLSLPQKIHSSLYATEEKKESKIQVDPVDTGLKTGKLKSNCRMR